MVSIQGRSPAHREDTVDMRTTNQRKAKDGGWRSVAQLRHAVQVFAFLLSCSFFRTDATTPNLSQHPRMSLAPDGKFIVHKTRTTSARNCAVECCRVFEPTRDPSRSHFFRVQLNVCSTISPFGPRSSQRRCQRPSRIQQDCWSESTKDLCLSVRLFDLHGAALWCG